MSDRGCLISTGSFGPGALGGQVAIVTGAGGGIGFEAARALAWLGAQVVIAEIDPQAGAAAAERLCDEMGSQAAAFVKTDVGDEASVAGLAQQVLGYWKHVDVVLNNATVAHLGAVMDTAPGAWDRSYLVNLRGPVLLARAFLPGMVARKQGVFVCVSSSGAAPYMGPYEVFKTAQVELSNTLVAELEGTGVIAFTIGPGLAATRTFENAARQLAPLYGKTVEEFRALSKGHFLSVEAAGAGFAAAIALAPQFAGQEISSVQALMAAGIDPGQDAGATQAGTIAASELAGALTLCRQVKDTLREQAQGWAKRSLFERQWVVRDFKKNAGMPVDEWLNSLTRLEERLAAGDAAGAAAVGAPLDRLAAYYAHLYALAEGYVKDPVQRQEQLAAVRGWQEEVARLAALLQGRAPGEPLPAAR